MEEVESSRLHIARSAGSSPLHPLVTFLASAEAQAIARHGERDREQSIEFASWPGLRMRYVLANRGYASDVEFRRPSGNESLGGASDLRLWHTTKADVMTSFVCRGEGWTFDWDADVEVPSSGGGSSTCLLAFDLGLLQSIAPVAKR